MNKKRSTVALLALIVTLIIILASILGSFLFVPPVSSNTGSAGQGTISGKVTDPSGIPIQGAQVSVGGSSALTDDSGNYLLNVSSGILKNVVELDANASGYQSRQVQLNPNGQNVSHDISLDKLVPDQTVQITDSPYSGFPMGVSASQVVEVEESLPGLATLQTGLFMLEGVTYTPYLRILVGETYSDGSWLPAGNASEAEYVGGQLNSNVTDYASSNETAFEVQPLTLLGGFIPTSKAASSVTVGFPLQYFKDQQVFFSPREFSDPYNVSHISYEFNTYTLENAKIVSDSRYLGISSELLEQLKPLAMNITRNISSRYDQAKAIQDYLKQNYVYSPNYPLAPYGMDPVVWFLLNSTRGMCAQFSSAFVLLARSIGIPARIVGGYLVDPTVTNQTVVDGQRHLYAEVPFQNIGWITFDPTPAAVYRAVAIDYPVYGSSVSGSSIFINGTIINPDNSSSPPFISSNAPFRLVFWNSSSGEFSFANTTDLVGTYQLQVAYTDTYGNTVSSSVGFDSVPEPENLLPTVTTITQCGSVGLKGRYFNVQGTVTSSSSVVSTGSSSDVGVDNLNVLIYLTKDKNQGGVLVGQGKTADGGLFNITCYVDPAINVGGYQVVAHTIGYGEYLDSRSDPEIKIMAETSLFAQFPNEIITQRMITLSGTLNETVSNEPVAYQPVLISLGDQNLSLTTDSQGFFATSFFAGTPGNYSYSATFQGSDLYLNTTQSGTFRIRSVTISPETPKVLIRSNTASITGHVYAEDLPLPSERLAISFNGSQLGFATTDVVDGFFNLSYQFPFNQALGTADVVYQLVQVPKTEYTQNVAILAQAFISCNASKSLKAGDTLNFTVILQDDHQQPMTATPVNLECTFSRGHTTSLRGITDNQGEVEYTAINMPYGVGANVIYNTTFAGDSLHAASFVSGTIKVSQTFPFITLLIVVGICTPASVAVATILLRRKPKHSTEKIVETVAVASELPTIVLSTLKSKRKAEISLVFPQILNQFPLVWGINDPMIIRLQLTSPDKLKSLNLSLQINDEAEQSLKTSKGNAETKHDFTAKGTYRLKAKFEGDDEWDAAMTEKNLKIVEYREEIVDLFNSFFKSAKSRFKDVRAEMTPRELEAALVCQIGKPRLQALDRVVSIFELADYSLHEVKRKDYEEIYLALKELES